MLDLLSTVIYRPRAVNVLVPDVEGDDVIASAGIDILVNIKSTLNRNGYEYAMINLNPQIKKVFEITCLTPILDVFESKINMMNLSRM